jgi:hypothetical protein
MKRVTLPILIGKAVSIDNTLGGSRSTLTLPLDDLACSWTIAVHDDNGKKMKRTRIKIDDNIYIALLYDNEVEDIINERNQVGYKNK